LTIETLAEEFVEETFDESVAVVQERSGKERSVKERSV
jgi:hypothetical protein